MPAMGSDSRPSERDESQLSAPPPSDSDSSDSEAQQGRIEWLATTRARRSTAGNRMKSMLANEEPDSDLELLFASDENDQGFSDAGEDASDVQMDSSSDDDGENHAGDDLEGERELERQAKERQRKRKAQGAIPAKFRKKVRIDPAASDTSAPAPAPRPKKKSERTSWLPSPADLPTRSSSRKTTRMSKEQLHQQMLEREERRLKLLDQMKKKAAKMEALKKPPLTQQDRLREAAIVEKRNSKSLNRWEVAEKQREEERKAKLAALNQRTLKGPVITSWTGIGEARRAVVEEEKPKRKRDKVDKGDRGKGKEARSNDSGNPSGGNKESIPQESQPKAVPLPTGDSAAVQQPKPGSAQQQSNDEARRPATAAKQDEDGQQRPRLMAMPPMPPQASSPLATPSGVDVARPPETSKPSGVLAAPALAPPPSTAADHRPHTNSSVLAPPNTSRHGLVPAPPVQGQASGPVSGVAATTTADPVLRDKVVGPIGNEAALMGKSASPRVSEPPPPSASVPTPETTTTRNAIIFRNFEENAIKDRSVQTQILFGRKMNRLSKPPPTPNCVITNLPARYRDPKSGLPYHNAYAYREIQRLSRGEHRWSNVLDAWVGSGKVAARGVPARFLKPGAPSEAKATSALREEKPAGDAEALSRADAGQPRNAAEKPRLLLLQQQRVQQRVQQQLQPQQIKPSEPLPQPQPPQLREQHASPAADNPRAQEPAPQPQAQSQAQPRTQPQPMPKPETTSAQEASDLIVGFVSNAGSIDVSLV